MCTAKTVSTNLLQRPTLISVLILASSICLTSTQAFSQNQTAVDTIPAQKKDLTQDLNQIRKLIVGVEKDLIQTLKKQSQATESIAKTRRLLALQGQERELSRQRQQRLEKAIREIELRREDLLSRIREQQKKIRTMLMEISDADRLDKDIGTLLANEPWDAPRRMILSRLVDRSLKEIETLKVDLADAERLEAQIAKERDQLDYLFQDLNERASVLEFHKKLQFEILKKSHQNRVSQLEKYRELKSTEGRVEDLIQQFNARILYEKSEAKERAASKAVYEGNFEKQRGNLPLPVVGKIITSFGQAFDQKLGLKVFKKGVDIDGGRLQKVRAVHAGKVVYSGTLSSYGLVTIIDHGAKYYTLCAQLGRADKVMGDWVNKGDVIGLTDSRGTALYYEIRSRNVAVNPLQWSLK